MRHNRFGDASENLVAAGAATEQRDLHQITGTWDNGLFYSPKPVGNWTRSSRAIFVHTLSNIVARAPIEIAALDPKSISDAIGDSPGIPSEK